MERKIAKIPIFIYGTVFFFFVFKLFFFAAEVGEIPDEGAHIGYVCYLNEHSDQLVPDFEDMHACSLVEEHDGRQTYQIQQDEWNYLGHPPLYYHMMKPFSGMRKEGDQMTVNIKLLRYANIFLTAGTMALCFYLGYSRLRKYTKKILPHVIFSVSAVSVPMLAYTGAGVSNDNLAFTGMVLFFWGLLRYYENQINQGTYLLVGMGFFVTMLSKLTAGEILVVALLLVLINELIHKRGFQIVWNRYFAVTLVFYLVPIAYYLYLYSRYGGVQPSLQTLHYDAYIQTGFFVPEDQRPAQYTFLEYAGYYWRQFIYSWVTIYGPMTLDKARNFVSWIGPGFVLILSVGQGIRAVVRKSKMAPMYFALLGGMIVTGLTQFLSAYRTYCSAGYMGGYQARYYLCVIGFLAYGGAMFWCEKGEADIEEKEENKEENEEVNEDMAVSVGKGIGRRREILLLTLGILYIAALLYGDFIYVLLHGTFRM